MHRLLHVHPHACVIGAGAHDRRAFYWGEVWQCEGIEAGGSQMSLVRTSTLMSLPDRSLLYARTIRSFAQVCIGNLSMHPMLAPNVFEPAHKFIFEYVYISGSLYRGCVKAPYSLTRFQIHLCGLADEYNSMQNSGEKRLARGIGRLWMVHTSILSLYGGIFMMQLEIK